MRDYQNLDVNGRIFDRVDLKIRPLGHSIFWYCQRDHRLYVLITKLYWNKINCFQWKFQIS